MNQVTQQLTSYFKDVQQRSNLVDQHFDNNTRHKVVPCEEVKSGKLSPDVTEELLAWEERTRGRYKKHQSSSASSNPPKTIDVIISLATLTDSQSSNKSGLALIAAKLSEEGELQADLSSATPWIPSSRLQSPGVEDHEFMVGTLKKYWRWCNNQGSQLESEAETWQDAVAYCISMFEGVSDFSLRENLDSRWDIDQENCYIVPGTIIKANAHVLNLYQFLQKSDNSAPLYESLLTLNKPKNIQSDDIDKNATTLLESALRACGSMSDGFPLTASQRRAVHAFLHDQPGDITAVSGPPGTGKTTMLQSVVASILVRHALEQKSAPLIVGMSTNNQAVTNIIDSFGSVTKDEPEALDYRWLTKAEDGAATSESLGGLATYCPSQAKAKTARDKGYLLEDTGKRGIYSEYSSSTYIQEAEKYFLARINEYCAPFMPSAVESLEKAQNILANFLKACDQARENLLRTRREADKGIGETTEQLKEQQKRFSNEQYILQSRLDAWIAAETAALPAELIVDITYEEHEPAPRLATVSDFISFYKNRLSAVALEMFDLDQRLKGAAIDEERASRYYQQEATKLINSIRVFALLNDEKITKLIEAKNLLELDQALDVTLRYTEFWLAVHYYEAEWLLTALDDEELIPENERYKNTPDYMQKYWQQVASLTPCFVMTAYQVPKYFSLYAPAGEPSRFDLERIDLLIVDEAGQVDTSIGAGAFALAQRALVVGDVQQLAPVWSVDSETDQGIADAHQLAGHWEEMKELGLTSSQPSALMKAAFQSSNWVYSDKEYPGLFLSEHFRCHTDIIEYCNDLLYDGLLIPSRPLKGYKLEGKTPHAFLFQQVENSQDRRSGSSRVNDREAEDISDWIIGNFDYFSSIYNPGADAEKDKAIFAVVTPFSAQAKVIRSTLGRKNADLASKVTVGTAHTLQGAERQVVLFSPVYGDNSGKASFVDSTLELMNVAVSRAKDLFIVFGGQRRWEDTGPVFKLVHDRAEKGPHWFGHNEPATFAKPVTPGPERTPEPEPIEPAPVAPTPVAPAPPISGTPTPMPPAPRSPATNQPLAPSPAPSSSVRLVDRHEPGYMIATEMLDVWKQQGILPVDSKAKAKEFNAAMKKAELLAKPDGTWIPTSEGIAIGISLYEGESHGQKYTSPIYSPQAQEALADMVRSGRLAL